MKEWDVKVEKVVIHPAKDGLVRMTEVRWREGPFVDVDATCSPPRVFVARRLGGPRRDVTNLLARLAARKKKSV